MTPVPSTPPEVEPAPVSFSSSAQDFGVLNGFGLAGPAMSILFGFGQMGDPFSPPLNVLFLFGEGNAANGQLTIEKIKSNFILDLFWGGDKWVIRLPALPENSGKPILFRNLSLTNWVMVPGQTYSPTQIETRLYFNGYYQIFVPILNLPFSFGEVYVYPNPVRGEQIPVLHAEVGQADVIRARIYGVDGDLIYESRINEAPIVVDGKSSYEHRIDPSRLKSGAYIGVITAEKSGRETVRKKFRFSIIK